MDTEFQVSRYHGKYYWTFTDRGAGMHGPFDTEQAAIQDAKKYLDDSLSRISRRVIRHLQSLK